MMPRCSLRKAVTMSARCRTETGLLADVVITDLTSEGCCILAKSIALKTDLVVWITPAHFQLLRGVVRWIAGDYAGIEFEKPLYGPVSEDLQRRFSAIRD